MVHLWFSLIRKPTINFVQLHFTVWASFRAAPKLAPTALEFTSRPRDNLMFKRMAKELLGPQLGPLCSSITSGRLFPSQSRSSATATCTTRPRCGPSRTTYSSTPPSRWTAAWRTSERWRGFEDRHLHQSLAFYVSRDEVRGLSQRVGQGQPPSLILWLHVCMYVYFSIYY